MNKTAISWTKYTNNPIRFRVLATGRTSWHCEKVSQGCKHCYAETLNMRLGSNIPFTVGATEQHECFFDDRMAGKVYTIKDEHARVFPFDMTDIFGAFIPDYIRAAAWVVMLDNPQLDFQVLTKRAASTVNWPERFRDALASAAYARLAESVTHKRVKAAMTKKWPTPWGDNIWMGASVESAETMNRIEHLRACGAKTTFISAEPLLGAWGPDADLTGIDWIIVGGESGKHLTGPEHPRWMRMEWAREIRDLCVAQHVAFFFKQDSGVRTELRPYLVEADGAMWRWHQYPGDLAAPVQVDKNDRPVQPQGDTDMPGRKTTVVNFRDVQDHWDQKTATWDDARFLYIGRRGYVHNLPASRWCNPYPMENEADRAAVIAAYRQYITQQLAQYPERYNLDELRGKTLVCWCAPKPCHGDVLLELLGEAGPADKAGGARTSVPTQMALL